MERRIPGYCPLCISRCGCISVVNGDGVLAAVEADPEHPTGPVLCIKGKAAPQWVNSPERILHPLKRTTPKGSPDPGWRRIGWDEALDWVAARMKRTAGELGPEAVAFSVATPSGTAIADGVGWIFRLARAFGSPNAVWTTHVCNWHRDNANMLTFGADIGMPDYAGTGCIVHWGFNSTLCWPAQARLANEAIKRGAKLIVVDPRRIGMAGRADQWLRVRPGSDGALALSLAGEMIANGWYDREFIASWSNGPLLVRRDTGRFLREADIVAGGSTRTLLAWDEQTGRPVAHDSRAPVSVALSGEFTVATLLGEVTCSPAFDRYAQLCREYSPERVERITGVPAAQIRQTARILHEHAPVSCYAWSGVGQNTNATQTSRAMGLLYALTGCIDAPGGNVYFARPKLNDVSGADLLSAEQRAKTLGMDARPLGPAKNAWITEQDFYRAVLEKRPYAVKGLVAFGSNLLQSRPDPETGARALQALDFYLHADLFHSAMSDHADILLPVASPWEREGIMPGFQISQAASAQLQLRPSVVEALGEAKSDTWIAFELAKRLQLDGHFFDGDIETGIRHVLEPSGVTLEALCGSPRGVELPLSMQYRKYRETGFATPSGLIEIYSEQLLEIGQAPLPEFVEPALSPRSQPRLAETYPLVLTSAKVVQFCHSQQRNVPELRGRMPEPLLEIHPDCAAQRGISSGDWVLIRTQAGQMGARARFNPSLATNVVCAQYGWWQAGMGPANYSGLLDGSSRDPVSGSVSLRAGLCEVERLTGTTSS